MEPELRSGRQAGAWAGQLNCSTWNTCTKIRYPSPQERPDQIAGQSTNGPKLWKNSATAEWFNTAAFTCPGGTTAGACGTAPAAGWGFYGDAQTGIIRGPGQYVFNMALFKDFHFTEKDFVEFRAEAFNTFNHTNPGNPNTTLGNANFGKVTSAADPRILELALRVKF